jgi:outer membrane protein assembly factor BamB
MLNGDTFVAFQDRQLIGINIRDGSLEWSQPSPVVVDRAVIDANRSVIYDSNIFGVTEAFRLSDPQDGDANATSEPSLEPMWRTELDASGFATLMPLPGGGVVVSFRQRMFGVSPTGVQLWELDPVARVFDWALGNGGLIFSTAGGDGSIWMIGESGSLVRTAGIGGHLVIADDQIWAYDEDGIYSLDFETLSAELLYALPTGFLGRDDMVALPDGGVLVAHTDVSDRRLIALHADGTLRWQRSCSDIIRGQQRLLALDGRAYLVSRNDTTSSSEISIFAIDLNSAELTRIFTGGSRSPLSDNTWAFAVGDDSILVNVGGGSMVMLDPRLAMEAVLQATDSQ